MLVVVRWYAIETRGFHGTSSASMVVWNVPTAHIEKYISINSAYFYALRVLQRFYTFHSVTGVSVTFHSQCSTTHRSPDSLCYGYNDSNNLIVFKHFGQRAAVNPLGNGWQKLRFIIQTSEPEAADTRLESTRVLKQCQHQSNFTTPIFMSRGVEADSDPPDVEARVHDFFSNTTSRNHFSHEKR